jgi:YidC/Oxa1 family membrane protein insertase
MISNLYHILVFNPLYNGLIILFDLIPWIDAGFAVIIFTIIVRLILFPISKKSVITQVRMKEIEPELNRLKQTIPDKQQQALKVMELYKTKGVNPFSSFFLLFLQLPIILALYKIFVNSGLPIVDKALLYSFVNIPNINMNFLGIFDISSRSIFLSVLASIAQYLQLRYSFASNAQTTQSSNQNMNVANDMMKNMKYIFPVMVFLISYKVSAVVAIYWIVSSLFTLGQELVVRKHLKKHQPL